MKKASVRRLTLPEGTDTASLFGSYDTHLKLIEDAFFVKVAARGEGLLIEGESAQTLRAQDVVLRLAARLNERGGLTVGEVQGLILSSEDTMPRLGTNHESMSLAGAAPLVGRRGPIIAKSAAQKSYIDSMRKHDVVVGIGPAGTGKTYLAVALAVSLFLKRVVSRIIFTRPAVEAGERLGFLPGDMVEKVSPFLRPLYDALYDMMEFERARQLIERGDIEIAPLAFMRGRTLNDAFIILDEAQNATSEQMKMFLTRLGVRSKAVIVGDITQIDLPVKQASGLIEIQSVLEEVSEIKFIYFTEKDVVRHKLVREIVRAYERHEAKNGKTKRKA